MPASTAPVTSANGAPGASADDEGPNAAAARSWMNWTRRLYSRLVLPQVLRVAPALAEPVAMVVLILVVPVVTCSRRNNLHIPLINHIILGTTTSMMTP